MARKRRHGANTNLKAKKRARQAFVDPHRKLVIHDNTLYESKEQSETAKVQTNDTVTKVTSVTPKKTLHEVFLDVEKYAKERAYKELKFGLRVDLQALKDGWNQCVGSLYVTTPEATPTSTPADIRAKYVHECGGDLQKIRQYYRDQYDQVKYSQQLALPICHEWLKFDPENQRLLHEVSLLEQAVYQRSTNASQFRLLAAGIGF
jgi:hypothetical protein